MWRPMLQTSELFLEARFHQVTSIGGRAFDLTHRERRSHGCPTGCLEQKGQLIAGGHLRTGHAWALQNQRVLDRVDNGMFPGRSSQSCLETGTVSATPNWGFRKNSGLVLLVRLIEGSANFCSAKALKSASDR